MATAYSALGSSVTFIARDGVLPNVEPYASAEVVRSIEDAGVRVMIGASPVQVRRDSEAIVHVTLEDGETIDAEEVLVATGRKPNTADLGLESIGLVPGSWLTVDETLRVMDADGNVLGDGWLYAAGDVNRRVLLTHQGKYQARAVGEVIVARATGTPVDDAPWGRHVATADHHAVPQVIFSSPEIVSVGHTAASAATAGLTVRVAEYDLGAVAGAALHADGYTGRASILVDDDRDVIVGFTAVGPDTTELVHAATIAIAGEVPIDRLWHAVPAYPTISEIWLRLLETLGR